MKSDDGIKASWLQKAAVCVVMVPTTLFLIPLWGAFNEPSLFADYRDAFLIFLGIPYATGFVLWNWARRFRRSV